MSGFRRYLQTVTRRCCRRLISVASVVVEAGRRYRQPSAPVMAAPSATEQSSTVLKFRRYRDPAHLNPEPVPGGAVILAFRRRPANDVDPNEPRAHAS